jgi:putative DNA primase/helicase
MTPPLNALIDVQLERQLVAALIANPDQHAICGALGVSDFGDLHAQRAWLCLANVLARGEWVTPETLSNEAQSHFGQAGAADTLDWHDLQWLTDLIATPYPVPHDIPVWASQVLVLAETRQAAIQAAERPPARTPKGPRAENVEPVRLAEAFRRYAFELAEIPTLVRWARAWWRYDGTRYVEHDDELLDRDVISFLDVVVAPQEIRDKDTKQIKTTTRRVTHRKKTSAELRHALLHVMPSLVGGAPQWTAHEPGDVMPDNLIPVANGLLDVNSRTLHPSTPRFFSTTAIGTSWDPDAPEPAAWLAFLDSLWPDDRESIRALQQAFGYLLTADTSQQKLFALIGPPRSGKGTIARILRGLLGDEAVVNPTLQSLERPFGLAPLVGKTLAIIGDARLGGKSDQAQVVERLLSISGEDSLSIDRKNRDPVNVRLKCRVLLLSNELPRLYDTSGALASRFLILCLSRSFLGSEDTGLEGKLLAELPGILRWAMDGRDDLAEAGRFITPAASDVAQRHLNAISNPLGVFLEECCEMGPGHTVSVTDFYARYRSWCESSGREPANKQVFCRDVHTLHPHLETTMPRRPDGTRIRIYQGIRCNL